MEGRNALFQKLKPTCVALSQAALSLHGSRGDIVSVTKQLEDLCSLLGSIASEASSLDAKLAEYVFFPISQVLKASQKVSITVLELSLRCIAILVKHGWKQTIPAQLAAQMVILCSLLAEKKPRGLAFVESTDELQTSALWCLYHIFSVVGSNSETANSLVSESNYPQLGQTVSVVLDSIEGGGSVDVQLAGVNTLGVLVSNIMDSEIEAGFLPGITSKLTRILMPQTKSRRNHRVLVSCLNIFATLLRDTMSDVRSQQSLKKAGNPLEQNGQRQAASIISETWQQQAASQLKPALINIIKLKAHSRDDVQGALARLCVVVLQDCRQTLSNCSDLALETLTTIHAWRPGRASNTEFEMLIIIDHTLSTSLQSVLYDWLRSLVTVMQSSDEQSKTLRMQQIITAYEVLRKADLDMSAIDRMLATTLRDVTVAVLTNGTKPFTKPLTMPIQSLDLASLNDGARSMDFAQSLVTRKDQELSIGGIKNLVQLISLSAPSTIFTSDLVRHLRQSHGEGQIANFWLLLTATQTALQRKDNVDGLLDLEPKSFSIDRDNLEDLYSFSLSILTETSEQETDPRLRALALQALALRAQTAGRDFRYELIDALYPVLHTLATPDENLQRDSIVALNVLTSSCGYRSVSDLIVQNVDYLTNAVALKLNVFDVSPQAPQVLLMMVRLAGSSLLPYLEDTVESIFAALEDFHGYPLLVELLFRVLGVITEEGSRAPKLAVTDEETTKANLILVEAWQPTKIAAVATLLRERRQERNDSTGHDIMEREPHPKRPWKDAEMSGDELNETDGGDEQDQRSEDSKPGPPVPKIYNLLFRIAELTQHFLPSASPSLRVSLLSLIRTAVPAIALHEDSFLPLINTLWPEVVSRVNDEEPYIVSAALEVIALFCQHARQFMHTRIAQLWPMLEEIRGSALKGISAPNTHPSLGSINSDTSNLWLPENGAITRRGLPHREAIAGSYSNTSNQILWQNLVGCLVSIVRFVQIAPEKFDRALEMLEPALDQKEVQLAFAAENPDALWLAQVRRGAVAQSDLPTTPGSFPWQFSEVSG